MSLATEEAMVWAYRLLLGREADDDGRRYFLDLINQRCLSTDELTRFFLDSPEFRAKHELDAINDIVEVNLTGYSMYVRTSDRDVGSAIAAKHQYEPHVLAALEELLRPGMTFVDVGANIGFFVAFAAHRVGPSGRVIAVEPLEKNLQLIYATIWRNRFDWVDVYPFAAGSESKLVAMATGSRSSNAEIREISLANGEERSAIFAPVRALDTLLPNLGRADVLMFDIEGFEPHAWKGFEHGIAKTRPIVFTEFHPRCLRSHGAVDPSDYLRHLLSYGREIKVLHQDGTRISCGSVEEVLREWQSVDSKRQNSGFAHIDLCVYPKPS